MISIETAAGSALSCDMCKCDKGTREREDIKEARDLDDGATVVVVGGCGRSSLLSQSMSSSLLLFVVPEPYKRSSSSFDSLEIRIPVDDDDDDFLLLPRFLAVVAAVAVVVAMVAGTGTVKVLDVRRSDRIDGWFE